MTAGPALPRLAELAAPADWRAVEFLSDIHLHPDQPRTFAAWRQHLLRTDADAVFLLGDVFEVWVGDDALAGPFEQACFEVLAEAARRGRWLGFMAGNRDFLLGPEACATGALHALDDPTVLVAFGQRWLLTHGDALCLDDTDYQRFRAMVRGQAWQRDFLARPLAERQALARQMRDASSARQAGMNPADWADADPAEAARWLAAAQAPQLIHGHTHRPGFDAPAPGLMRHVLSDWAFDGPGAPRGDLLRLTAGGLERRAPLLAA